jgi:ribosomal protein L40E
MPFENGWICRECWSANREQDERCYRCHSVPKRHQKPEATTFSTPDGKPNEDRPKVSSLTGPRVEQAPAVAPAAVTPRTPRTPFLEQIGVLAVIGWARTGFAAIAGVVARVLSFGRAVRNAPGAGARRVSSGVRGARSEASSRARSVLSHRRAWLSAAWVISALSSALLFSAALHAPFAASLLVVISVAIFSGLTAAITSNVSDRKARGIMERSTDPHVAPEHVHAFVPAPDHAPQPAEAFGSRPAR